MSIESKLKYFVWAATRLGADRSCPACQSRRTTLIKRKYLVTSLYLCQDCRLLFRVPKCRPADNDNFYQQDYSQGFTTECPNPNELEELKRTSFRGMEKDYSPYIAILRALGLQAGCSLFEFGSSWGYGSWQLRQAGFRVYSCEISQPRARYAAENLGCEMCTPEQLPEKVDCFLSAHVIEHLTSPRILWDAAEKALKSTGILVVLTPNGESAMADVYKIKADKVRTREIHRAWGQRHPLLLTAEAFRLIAADYGFTGCAYSSPYDLQQIARGEQGRLEGSELLLIARRG